MGLSWNVKYDESPLAMEMKYNKGQKIRGVLWLLKNIRKWNLYFVYWKLQLLTVLVLFGTWLRHRLGIESYVTSKGASTAATVLHIPTDMTRLWFKNLNEQVWYFVYYRREFSELFRFTISTVNLNDFGRIQISEVFLRDRQVVKWG